MNCVGYYYVTNIVAMLIEVFIHLEVHVLPIVW